MRLSGLAFCAVIAAAPAVAAQETAAQEKAIDTQRSAITIHVGKSGLLSAAAHDHTVNAPISSGTIVESGAARIEFRIETAKMKVKPDPKIDAKDQATIQTHMEELTLETKSSPRSPSALPASGNWRTDNGRSMAICLCTVSPKQSASP